MCAGAAPEVEEPARSGTEQTERRSQPVIVQVAEKLRVVPVRGSVVSSHRSMLARCLEPPAHSRCRGADMRRGLLVGALAALLLAAVGSAAPEKSPRVSLTARPSTLVAGRPWAAVLAVRGSQPSRVALTATLGGRRVAASARRWRRGRYRARLVFPAPGRWRLAAKIGRTRVPLGAVAVRAATRPPLVLVAPTEAVLEPNGSILVAESGQSRLARIDPTTGRDTLVTRIVQPYGLVLTPSGVLYSTSESRVVRVGSGGSTTTIADAGEDVGPLALDPSGNLYFSTVSRIFRIEGGTGAGDSLRRHRDSRRRGRRRACARGGARRSAWVSSSGPMERSTSPTRGIIASVASIRRLA